MNNDGMRSISTIYKYLECVVLLTMSSTAHPKIHWKLKELLKAEGVSVYRLYQELAKHVSRTALYTWTQKTPQRLDLEVLAWVMWGLKEITGKEYKVGDLLEYRDSPHPQ